MVNIFDARLLFFPVFSMAGPVWATTPRILEEAGFEFAPRAPEPGRTLITRDWAAGQINLGWILLPTDKATVTKRPEGFDNAAWEAIQDRIVILDEKIFTQVVNSNLEVRTSVSIDATTGAAREGALFTYEALPRSTWLCLEVVEHFYRPDRWKNEIPAWRRPIDVLRAGLDLAATLGVGGMGTRGFGRIRLLGLFPVGGAA
jgi:CRISPR-associated protein Cmr4